VAVDNATGIVVMFEELWRSNDVVKHASCILSLSSAMSVSLSSAMSDAARLIFKFNRSVLLLN
jgi:hypothetical protein